MSEYTTKYTIGREALAAGYTIVRGMQVLAGGHEWLVVGVGIGILLVTAIVEDVTSSAAPIWMDDDVFVPDTRDFGTRGHMLKQARKAWGKDITVEGWNGEWWGTPGGGDVPDEVLTGPLPSEAAVLITVMRTVPKAPQ